MAGDKIRPSPCITHSLFSSGTKMTLREAMSLLKEWQECEPLPWSADVSQEEQGWAAFPPSNDTCDSRKHTDPNRFSCLGNQRTSSSLSIFSRLRHVCTKGERKKNPSDLSSGPCLFCAVLKVEKAMQVCKSTHIGSFCMLLNFR